MWRGLQDSSMVGQAQEDQWPFCGKTVCCDMMFTVLRNDICAIMASCLIALGKCPCRCSSKGIGEAPWQFLGRVIVYPTRCEVEECRLDQLCSWCMWAFDQHRGTGWWVLMVDANNGFNSLNWEAALWIAWILWPHCSSFLFNTYHELRALMAKELLVSLWQRKSHPGRSVMRVVLCSCNVAYD